MNRIIKTIIIIIITCPLIAGTISNEKLSINQSRLIEFNSTLRDFDLNKKIQDGYSITETEYSELLKMWDQLKEKDKIQILNGSNKYSWKNTIALFLLYSLSNKADWTKFAKNISCFDFKGNSLTLSSVKSMVALKTVHYTLLDLLQKDHNMFTNGKLKISSVIKDATKNRKNQKAFNRLQKWENLINLLMNHSNADKIESVNNFFNEIIVAKSDHDNKSNRDYWQSPIETLVRGKGDCEDFAISKYVSLRLLGIPKNQLLISVVRLPEFGELHALLLYYLKDDNDPLVLDNLSYEIYSFSAPCIKRMSFMISQYNIKPLIAFNENQYIEFKRGLKRKYLNKNPMIDIPMFNIAINNSQSLLSNLSG